jgi:hypothetical protein
MKRIREQESTVSSKRMKNFKVEILPFRSSET